MRNFILFCLLHFVCLTSLGQQMRYFAFNASDCGHGNWQDTIFIAAASDQSLIDSVLAEIEKPYAERRFINGKIAHGNGGFNYNATHAFLWHFVPDEWTLVEVAIEVCDGCPYSDIDQDTAYFINTIGHYCPWAGKPLREIQVTGGNLIDDQKIFTVYPTQVKHKLQIKNPTNQKVSAKLYNNYGVLIKQYIFDDELFSINMIELPVGVYFIALNNAKIQESYVLLKE